MKIALHNIKGIKKYQGEIIAIKMKADSNGDLRIPVGGMSQNNSANHAYDWQVNYDGGAFTRYNGTGSATSIVIASGLTAGSEHIIEIRPTTEAYERADAFGFYNTGVQTLLTAILYDESYMGYAKSATQTGNYYRRYQYRGCTNLKEGAKESMPDTVTSVGDYFRSYQYAESGLTKAPNEVLSNNVTSIGGRFREYCYNNCTDLEEGTEEVFPDSVTTIGQSFRNWQYAGCNMFKAPDEKLNENITNLRGFFRNNQYNGNLMRYPADEYMSNSVTSIGNYFRATQYYGCVNLRVASPEVMSNNVTTIGTYFRDQQYAKCSSLLAAQDEVMSNSVTSIPNFFRSFQYSHCFNLASAGKECLSSSATSIGTNFRKSQYQKCYGLKYLPDEVMPDSVTTIGSNYRYTQYFGCNEIRNIAKECFSANLQTIGTYCKAAQYSIMSDLPTNYYLTEIVETPLPSSIVSVGAGFRYWMYESQNGIKKIILYAQNKAGSQARQYAFDLYGYTENTNDIDVYIYGDVVDNAAVGTGGQDNPKCSQAAGLAVDYVAHIYVPANMVNAYKAASNWSGLASKIYAMPE